MQAKFTATPSVPYFRTVHKLYTISPNFCAPEAELRKMLVAFASGKLDQKRSKAQISFIFYASDSHMILALESYHLIPKEPKTRFWNLIHKKFMTNV